MYQLRGKGLITDKHEEAFNKLNTKQQDAVLQIEGPVLVLAGPGTGKTEVLAVRIGQILKQQDVNPYNILCLTYSNAAVDAMRKRLLHLIGPDAERIEIFTYHSFCNKIINKNASDTFSEKKLITDAQRYMLIEKMIFEHLSPGDQNYLKPASTRKISDLSKIFSTLKQEGISSDQLVEHAEHCINNILPFEEKYLTKKEELNSKGRELKERIATFAYNVSSMYEDYNQQLEDKNKYEFEDMLTEGVLLLQSDKLLASRLHEQYQYILVDEFQDTNSKQLALIDQLCTDFQDPNIFAVGDDDQCIYRFQGANQHSFTWMRNKFARLRTIVLDINYRSTSVILQESFGLISVNEGRQPEKDKPLVAGNTNYHHISHKPSLKIYEDAKQEACDIARQIHETSGGQLNGIAILARKHKEFEVIMQWLDYYNIPYQTNRNWIDLLKTPFGKSVHYLLQFIRCHDENTYLAEGFLLQFLLHKKVGNDLIRGYLLYKQARRNSFFKWLICDENKIPALSAIAQEINHLYTKRHDEDFMLLVNSCIALAEKGVGGATIELEKKVLKEFITNFMATDRDKTIHSLANMISFHEQNGISIRVELGLQEDETQNAVILSTIHGSKGMEYGSVYLIGCQSTNWENRSDREGINVPDLLNKYIVPKPDSLDDMRRLVYVACTRAKTKLHVSCYRKNYNGKDISMSILLNGFKLSEQVEFSEVPQFDVPSIGKNTYQVAVDDELMNLIQERKSTFEISPTSTATWVRCQNEFFYNAVMKMPGTSGEAASFGTLVHAVLQTVVSNVSRQHDPAFIHNLVEKEMNKLKLNFHPTRIGRYKQYGKWLIMEYLRSYPFTKEPEHIEDEFHHVLSNGTKIKGKLDRVELYDDHVKVVDYKTGRNKEALKEFESLEEPGTQYWRQANMYTQLMQENFGDHGVCNFEFHYPENEKTVTSYDYQSNDAFEEWLGDIWKNTQSLTFTSNCENPDCVYCMNGLNDES